MGISRERLRTPLKRVRPRARDRWSHKLEDPRHRAAKFGDQGRERLSRWSSTAAIPSSPAFPARLAMLYGSPNYGGIQYCFTAALMAWRLNTESWPRPIWPTPTVSWYGAGTPSTPAPQPRVIY